MTYDAQVGERPRDSRSGARRVPHHGLPCPSPTRDRRGGAPPPPCRILSLLLVLALPALAAAHALDPALLDVREQPGGRVPAHLRDAHYPGAARLGHGDGYRYPHDEPGGWVEQEYRPARFEGSRYYEPSGMGEETAMIPPAEPEEEGEEA